MPHAQFAIVLVLALEYELEPPNWFRYMRGMMRLRWLASLTLKSEYQVTL
jgi:hypothetical protein